MPPAEVGVITVMQSAVAVETELPGRTAPFAESEVRPQVNGLIQRRMFAEGSYVRAGQPLYQIDSSLYRASLNEAAAAVENARANAVTTRLKSIRFSNLVAQDAVSRQEADDARALAAQANAQVKQNDAVRRTAQINVGFTTLRAPISGRIGRSAFTQGALVTASQASPLATIQRLDPIYVDITQSAADMLALRKALMTGSRQGTPTTLRLKLEDGSLYGFSGTITASDSMVDPDTGSVTIRASFPNPQNLLLPGMSVRAIVPQGTATNGVLVPQQAVTRNAKGDATVTIVTARNQPEVRVITTNQTVGANWLVTAGLRPGDRVVLEGLQKIRPGVTLKVVKAGSKPAARPAAAPPRS